MTENIRESRPWDLFNNNVKKVSKEIEIERLSICKQCPEFIKSTTTCKKCGCIMKMKTKLANASCPIDKWAAIEEEV